MQDQRGLQRFSGTAACSGYSASKFTAGRGSLKQPALGVVFSFPRDFVVADVKAVTLGQPSDSGKNVENP